MSSTQNGGRPQGGGGADGWAFLRVSYSEADRKADEKAGREAAAHYMPADPWNPPPPPALRVIPHEVTRDWHDLVSAYLALLTELEQDRLGLQARVKSAESNTPLAPASSTNGANGDDPYALYDAARARRLAARNAEALVRSEVTSRAAPLHLEAARNAMAQKLWMRLSVFAAALVAAHAHGVHLNRPLEDLALEAYHATLPRMEAVTRRLLSMPRQLRLPAAEED